MNTHEENRSSREMKKGGGTRNKEIRGRQEDMIVRKRKNCYEKVLWDAGKLGTCKRKKENKRMGTDANA